MSVKPPEQSGRLPRFPESVYIAIIGLGLIALVLPVWAQVLYVIVSVAGHVVARVLAEEDDGWR